MAGLRLAAWPAPLEAPRSDQDSTPISELITRQEEERAHVDVLKRWRLKVKSVCANKRIQISSLSEMLHIINDIQRDKKHCPKQYRAAIFELAALLLRRRERLCDLATFDMIKQYHFRFIQPKRRRHNMPAQIVKGQLHPEARKHTVEFDEQDHMLLAPTSIRHFFLRFALQVSHQCKMDLVRNLARDQERVLAPGDLELMAPFGAALLGGGGELALDFDNVLYIPELDGTKLRANRERYEPTDGAQRSLQTNADESSRLYRMIDACKHRFKPMYDVLILPIVRLSKLGYDYQGPKGWTEEERDFLMGPLMQDWLVIVHMCEMFKHTHLISMRTRAPRRTLGELLAEDPDERDLFEVVDDDDELEREEKLLPVSAPTPYKIEQRFVMSDVLLIGGRQRDLDLELSRKFGNLKEGVLAGFFRRLANYPKRALAQVDPWQFAHYRHNSGWYTGIIKFMASALSIVAIGFTIHGYIAG